MGLEGGTSTKTDKPQWYDPLGPASIGANGQQTFTTTGGVPLRDQVFNYLGNATNSLQNNASHLNAMGASAAADPGFTSAAALARRNINGDYLHGSPEFDAAMNAARTRTMADASDADARIQQQYGRAGMGWSTANQQARQANRSATAARAGETEAAARGANYMAERANQNAGAGQLQSALSTPMSYLSQANTNTLGPLSQAASIIQGLSGSGSVATPNSMVMKTPGALDYLSSGTSALGGLASLFTPATAAGMTAAGPLAALGLS